MTYSGKGTDPFGVGEVTLVQRYKSRSVRNKKCRGPTDTVIKCQLQRLQRTVIFSKHRKEHKGKRRISQLTILLK